MCWSSRWDTREAWEIERRPSERRPSADVRASDRDRQATIDQLSRHTGEGRLTLEEFEARVDETWRATTHGDLLHVLRELPVEPTPIRRRYPLAHLRRAASWLLVIVAAVVLIGPGSLWWLIPLAWFKLGAFGHHHHAPHHQTRRLPQRGDELTAV